MIFQLLSVVYFQFSSYSTECIDELGQSRLCSCPGSPYYNFMGASTKLFLVISLVSILNFNAVTLQ